MLLEQCENPYPEDLEVRLTPYQTFYDDGSEIIFSCPDGFDINGVSSATCVDGDFNITNPTCEGI